MHIKVNLAINIFFYKLKSFIVFCVAKLHATELFNRIEAHLNNLERNIENELLSLKTENSHLNSNFKKTKDEMLEMSKNFQLTNDQILKEERNFLELTEECKLEYLLF